jgi:hypothetical protein
MVFFIGTYIPPDVSTLGVFCITLGHAKQINQNRFGSSEYLIYLCILNQTNMNVTIQFQRNGYGFGYDWNLVVNTDKGVKSFYLGQDSKFCTRVLGLSPREVINEIGTDDLRTEENRNLLGQFIVDHLGLDEEKLESLSPWELCCQ